MLESYHFSGSLKRYLLYHDNLSQKTTLNFDGFWENYLAYEYDIASQVI